jgi:hypothetical protein
MVVAPIGRVVGIVVAPGSVVGVGEEDDDERA